MITCIITSTPVCSVIFTEFRAAELTKTVTSVYFGEVGEKIDSITVVLIELIVIFINSSTQIAG